MREARLQACLAQYIILITPMLFSNLVLCTFIVVVSLDLESYSFRPRLQLFI